jgi:ABC-type uncharacterized transport system permease subunit
VKSVRTLGLTFVLTILSLAGVLLTALALGGVEPWTRWQFIGLYGVVESAAGIASIILPNIWRLPVSEVQTKKSTHVKLAASAIFIPHWAGVARFAAGITILGVAAVKVGVGPGTAALPILLILLAIVITGISMLFARLGVWRPDIDVVQLIIRRPNQEIELPPISLGASLFQFILSIITLPFVQIFSPSVLYQPEMGPSAASLAVTFALAVAVVLAVVLSWRGRMDVRAPADQQRDAEQYEGSLR